MVKAGAFFENSYGVIDKDFELDPKQTRRIMMCLVYQELVE